MSIYENTYDLSQLEQEFELEMDDPSVATGDGEMDEELEALMGDESEYEYENDSYSPYENEQEDHLEEWEYYDDTPRSYAERLFELSQREFENENELDSEINRVMEDIEREKFWGFIKKVAKKAIKNPLVRSLAKKAFNLAKSSIPFGSAFQGITQLVRGNLKGALGSTAKALINTAVPGAGAVISGIADMTGVNSPSNDSTKQQVLEKFVAGAEKAYEYAAQNLHPDIDNPIEANKLAGKAFEVAIGTMQGRPARPAPPPSRPRRITVSGQRVVTLQEKPGEEIKSILIHIQKTK